MESSPSTPTMQTVMRAAHALKLVARHRERGIRLVDFAMQMGLERPTAHRLLKALTAEGMLIQDAGSRRFSLGSLVFELGLAATHQFNLCEICHPVLSLLAEQTGDTAFLFLRSGNDAVCIDRVQGTYPIRTLSAAIGSRQPLGVHAGGLALLSALHCREAEEIIEAVAARLSVYGDLDMEQLLEHWMRAQQAGYALIHSRALPRITSVGLPVMSKTDLPIAAIAVASIHSRVTEVLPLLRQGALEMARLLHQ